MKIGIDISQSAYEGTGVARFTKGLVRSILTYNRVHEYVFLFSSLRKQLDPLLEKEIRASKHQIIKLPVPPSALNFVWNTLHIGTVELLTNKLDWFVSSDWTQPPAHCKKATIVHDLVFKRYPKTVAPSILAVQEKRLQWVKKESDLIFADSLTTADDLTVLLDIPTQKIVVNYPGVEILPAIKNDQLLHRLGISKPYILTVGKREPRKNLKRLAEAFRRMNDEKLQLVIVGPSGWGDLDIQPGKDIVVTGYVSDSDLATLYTSSLFFIFPSLYEGFGYPAVEAMKYGVPTALADTSSLKEIGEEASVLFDPLDVKSIKDALVAIRDNEKMRSDLIQKGMKRAQEFTWQRYYEKMMEAITLSSC
ncbi:glycosyltransferase family 4 protein [Candidatus Roizmanbacteria bacterium]|nr:glycosyltransferase family 4 protein [Candidatus Roizmanbacteria bacterium]